MRYLGYVFSVMFCGSYAYAQHNFNGYIDNERWQSDVYLSVIDDYRTLESINNEQIISKASPDDEGYFQFTGNQLEAEQKIYKLHVDNCASINQESNHFEGHCLDSKDILFIAKNTDTISFPLSFDAQMFCDINSTNQKTAAFIKIDSLKEDMKFAYSEFRSKANRELNNKKWFKKLQDFGESLNEPLAELYIYAFLSERSSQFHNYYIEDLQNSTYYDDLLVRLKTKYPNASYTKQYASEIASDKYMVASSAETSGFNWTYVLVGLLAISFLLNLWFVLNSKKRKAKRKADAKAQLTKQEQNVLELILEDKTNKELAETLFVSVSTVKTHVNNVYKKLEVNSREELKSLFNK
ncbi:helix-turn-helix transcriptional regulator [Algibacter sp. 2305UL17-15]|uniref:helix-turn-helix domain-containing protein n=1 Tax=Algibacter sp. 2305UL17-15 TaxID=3231268 RepID=UPI00345A1C67